MLRVDGVDVSEVDDTFEDFFRSAWPRLYRTLFVVTGEQQIAEDVLQVAMVRAGARWPRVARMASPEAYVRRIAINEALARRRTSAARREHVGAQADNQQQASVETSVEDRDELWTAILRLAPRQRAVIVLRYYEDLSEAEIAEALWVVARAQSSLRPRPH